MKYRNLLLKVFSLGVGIAISFVLIAKVSFESSYDSFYKDIDRIYQIGTKYNVQGEQGEYPNISGAVAPGFKQYVPGVACATRITGYFQSRNFILEDRSVVTGVSQLADSCFFDVFDREILAGDPHQVLNIHANVMVSRSFAEKLGGIDKAVGQQIANEDGPMLKLTIGGVFEDFPKNGSLDFDVLLSLVSYPKVSRENWVGNDRYLGYVKLDKGVDPTTLTSAIRLMQEKNQPQLLEAEKQGQTLKYVLNPFSKLHTSDPQIRNVMLILSVVSFILLVISLMNYSLTTVSETVKRSKEMGVHKCYGAESWDIYIKLVKETGITLLWSLVLAGLLIWAAAPLIGELMGVKLTALLIPQTVVVLCIVLVVVFLVSVWVPGYLFNHVPVTIVIRNYQQNKRRWKLALLCVQFVINIFMASFVIIIAAQYHRVTNDDPGYNYDCVYYYNTNGIMPDVITRTMNQLKTLPEVTAMVKSHTLPMSPSSGNNIYLPGKDSELFNIADQYWASEGFFDFFKLELLEGRAPNPGLEVAISESFVKKMSEFADWSDGALGHKILVTEHSNNFQDAYTITGVYKDYLIGDQTDADARPSIRFTQKIKDWDNMPYNLMKLKDNHPQTIAKVHEVLQSCIEDRQMELYSYRDEFVRLYDDSKKMRNTILVGCIFAIVIAFLGLIGYIMDEALRRSKEIAIRKINGATTSEIISLFVKDIMKLALIAVVIGNAAAYYVSDLWLEQFAEKVSLSVGYFLAADVIVIGLIVSVVVLYSMKIAHANPVESLKSE